MSLEFCKTATNQDQGGIGEVRIKPGEHSFCHAYAEKWDKQLIMTIIQINKFVTQMSFACLASCYLKTALTLTIEKGEIVHIKHYYDYMLI